MSTRAQIRIKGGGEDGIYIYKHCDGYPEGVIPMLKPFVDQFQKERGCDDEAYLLAQIVRVFALDEQERIVSGECTGWGVDRVEHGDTEYLYEIDDVGNIYINGKRLTVHQANKYMK